MNRLQHIFDRVLMVFLLLIGMGCTVSCSGDKEILPPENEGPYRFSFNIVTRNNRSESRAADLDGGKVGSIAENYLDVNDLRCLIFNSDKKFVVDITPQADIMAQNDLFTIYRVTARIDHPYFIDNESNRIGFYIMVLANYTDWGYTLPALNSDVTIDNMFDHNGTLTQLPDASKLFEAVNGGDDSQRFPMAGIQYFIINRNNLYTSSEDEPFDLSNAAMGGKDINMLRALAKIEVIDHIDVGEDGFTYEDRDNPLRVASVELDGFMTQGLLLPTLNQWTRNVTNVETQQVIAASVPATATYKLPPMLNDDNTFGEQGTLSDYSINLVYDAAATAQREDKCPVYSCYVFEYSKAAADVVRQRQPYFRVRTQGRQSETDPVESLLLPMRLADYNNADGARPENIDALLRNHIYRYEIMAISQTITVNWTVCAMDNATINIGFN